MYVIMIICDLLIRFNTILMLYINVEILIVFSMMFVKWFLIVNVQMTSQIVQ